jgi:hypothetical protein
MQAEVQNRRDAETLDILAWALSRAGDWQASRSAIQEAVAQGCFTERLTLKPL